MLIPGEIYKVKNENIYGFSTGEIFMIVGPEKNHKYEILYYPMSSSGVWMPRRRLHPTTLTEEQIDNIGKKISSLDRCLK